MAKDIFGMSKEVHGANEIVQWSGVKVKISSIVAVAQSVTLTYQRQVQPIYELGSENIWVQATPATGTCEVSRAVSSQAMPYAYGTDNGCAPYDITLEGGQGQCTAKLNTITASGCVTISISESANAGQGFMTETLNAHVGMVTKAG